VASPPRSSASELSFRPLERSDFALVSRWLGTPHVARWWMEPADAASVEAKYGPCVDGTDPTAVFVIASGLQCIGMIQRYRLSDDAAWDRAIGMPGAAGIDYLIGEPEWLGIGVGVLAIAAFTDDVFVAYPDVSAVVAVPQQANTASWRALERAGYVRVRAGMIDSDDPSDAGPAFVYARHRDTARVASPVA
jgi:aminoglycoside 6'-N-acetyltransferase